MSLFTIETSLINYIFVFFCFFLFCFVQSPILRISIPECEDDLRFGLQSCTPNRAPRTPMSSSFDTGVDLAALQSRKATVPPSPIRNPISSSKVNSKGNQGSQQGLYPSWSSVDFAPETSTATDDSRGEREKDRDREREDENERNKNTSKCPIETQEILLFYTLSLLQTMALDSSKVRFY